MAETAEAVGRRGISQLDVWAAADAVLAEGRRPTIDAVRQRLGRGSPNTVMTHLDSWFGRLADRLSGPGTSAGPSLPAPVTAAAVHLWEAAMESANHVAEATLEAERRAVADERAGLLVREQALVRQEEANRARLQAAQEALQAAVGERAAAERREALACERATRLEGQLAKMTAELENLASEKRAQAGEIAALRRQSTDDRQKADERLAGQERHWLSEVERARVETQRAAKARMEAEATHRTELTKARLRIERAEAEATSRRTELEVAQVALARASAEAATLREALAVRPKGRGAPSRTGGHVRATRGRRTQFNR